MANRIDTLSTDYKAPEQPEVLIAVYGTLRTGQQLYKDYIQPYKHEVLGTQELPGFILWHLDSLGYPVAQPSIEASDIVICDVIRVTRGIHAVIDRMEQSAGYLPIPVETAWGEAFLYVQSPPATRIEHGDWVKYLNEREEQQY